MIEDGDDTVKTDDKESFIKDTAWGYIIAVSYTHLYLMVFSFLFFQPVSCLKYGFKAVSYTHLYPQAVSFMTLSLSSVFTVSSPSDVYKRQLQLPLF